MSLEILHPHSALPRRAHLKVDIVAVHGLRGDAITTWTEPKSKKFWLQDFLPADVDGARVMSFRYDPSAAFGNTAAEICDYASDLLGSLITRRGDEDETVRPIIFIAHSLGGIIVKQALVLAQEETKYENIKNHTRGIVFFATPHRGSSFANYGTVLALLATRLTNRPTPKLLVALRRNSETLLNLTEQFITLAPKYEIATFYELKPMGFSRSLIVKKKSAILGVEGEAPQPVTTNHVRICRFGSRDDPTYLKLISRLNGILSRDVVMHGNRQALESSKHTEPYNKFYEAPHNVSQIFTGRDDISGKLRAKCLPMESLVTQIEHKVFVLYGLGGIGKTQICLQFAQSHRESISTADQSFSKLAHSCHVGDDQEAFTSWLAKKTEHWLLVLDNADDPSVVLSRYFPIGSRGTIIITTRNPQHELYKTAGGGSARVDKLNTDEAVALLLKAVDDKDSASTNRAQPVVDLLGYIPLAIIHAGAAIRHFYTYEEYCEDFTHRRKDLLAIRNFQVGADYEHTVYTSWKVSVDAVKKIAEGESAMSETDCINAANALDLLNVFGFLFKADISEDIFEDIWESIPRIESDKWWMSNTIRMFREQRSPTWDPLPFREAINVLSNYSLVYISNRRISLHPLVQSCIQDLLDEKSSLQWWTTTLVMLSMAVSTTDRGVVRRQRLLSPHLDACLKRDIKDFLVEDDSAITCVDVINRLMFYRWRGIDLQDRLVLAQRAVEYCEKMLDEDDPRLWRCLDSTASHINETRQWQLIVDLLEIKVASYLETRTLDFEYPIESLQAMQRLIHVYRHLDRMQEASELAENVHEICRRSHGENSQITLEIEMDLAYIYLKLGRKDVALDMFHKANSRMEAALGEDNLHCLYYKEHLAHMYDDLGDTPKALDIYQQILVWRKELQSEDHVDTLVNQEDVARMYRRLGRPEDGIPLILDVLEKGERSGVSALDMQSFSSELEKLRAMEAKKLSQLEKERPKDEKRFNDKKGLKSGMKKTFGGE